jgi:DNA polymerase-3 subunit gamma/tau
MPAQALYRKWRPQLWEEVVGQDHVVQTLRNALRSERTAHAYLFAGPRGCGKTTSARLVAKALNCLHPDPAQRPDNTCGHCQAVTEGRFLDLIEIDGASNNSVDNVRELRDKINFAPGEGRYKVYIIDEVHMLSTPAFNALLKTLEEPPPHAVFILATTESYRIPATVTSRCQRFEFRRIPLGEIVLRLERLCEQEGVEHEHDALVLVGRQATGSLRDAISLLDQLIGAAPAVTLEAAQQLLGASAAQAVQDLVEALAAGDLTAGLDVVNAAVDAGSDPRQIARQVVDHLRNLMLVRLGNAALVEATPDARAAMAAQAERLSVPELLRAIRAFNAAANDSRGGWQPQLPLELAVVECARREAAERREAAGRPEAAGRLLEAEAEPAAPPQPARAVAAPARESARRTAGPERPAVGRPAPERAAPERAVPAAVAQDVDAKAEAAALEPPAPVEGASLSMGQLRGEWMRLLKLLQESDKATAALLRSCQLLGLEGNVLRLATSEFVHNKMNGDPGTREKIDARVAEVFGAACVVKYEVSGKRSGRRAEDIPQDGLVAAALDLGGEIIE